ncbi:hybrid sensor histidine kinase/response regulator transcription factor [Hoylesella enoeca]|nr:two-component regulator propeller domain-containing protein [Hoylesella enoeca]
MNKILLTFTLWIIVIALQAQNIVFNHLLPENGLSQISVNSLYVDENGKIWIATRVGLNCYNGNSIQVYRHSPRDGKSLFCNNVLRLTGNGKGKIYLLCSEGVAELDIPTHRFTTLKYGRVGSICYQNRLYISVGNTILTYSAQSKKFVFHLKLPINTQITSLMTDAKHRLWIGTQTSGVFCYAGKTLSHPIREGNITTIYEDSRHTKWIGSWHHGFWTIDANGQIKNIRQEQGLISDFVRAFQEDNEGKMWIGTFHGLMEYDQYRNVFRLFTAMNLPDGLTDSSIWSIIKDQQGTLWLGTYFGGVNYFNPAYEIFTHYRATNSEQTGLSNPVVGRMTEDDAGNLWICTEGGGLNMYNSRTKQFTWYLYPGNVISQNNLKAIYFDALRNTIWVGTHLGGLDRIDVKSGRSVYYRHRNGDHESLPSDIVRDIIADGRELIVATQDGVAIMNPEKGTFKQILVKEQLGAVPSICLDRQHRLWIATDGKGVFRYDIQSGKYTHFLFCKEEGSLSCNYINNIMKDSRGRIWLSTAYGGIDLYDETIDGFKNYGRNEGLLSDCVYTAHTSSLDANHLLLITNRGFSIFNINTQHFRNYDHDNGFPLATINENALYVTRNQEVFIGGVQGMVSFNEKDLHKRTKPYKLGFSRLFVNNKEVFPGDSTGILTRDLSYTKQIILPHTVSVFSIEYSTTNYIKANGDLLKYRLIGSSKEWIPIQRGQKNLIFTGLQAGKYTLELCSERSDIPVSRLIIRILPPWYLSWWAYLCYILLTSVGVWWLVSNYRNRIRLTESLEYEQQHVKDIEESNRAKIRFFTNVSHEIRTPLTIIIGLSEALLSSKTFSAPIYNKVLGIYKNSKQLKELISELLDFKKQELGHMHIHVYRQDLVAFVQEIYLLFKEFTANKEINLSFRQEGSLMVLFDQKQMQKVVNNLLSNAIKHTPQGGTITLTVTHDQTNALISVTNTGNGIPKQELDKVFTIYYQIRDFESLSDIGTGIGLHLAKSIVELHHGEISVDSQVGEQTTFMVKLPLNENVFSNEEIESEEPKVMSNSYENKVEEQVEESDDSSESLDATILIVEDHDDIRQLLVHIFSPYYHILTSVDGREALEIIHNEMPDLVVSDIVMPNMPGTKLCKAIKQDFSICHIPIVLLTARTSIENTVEGLKIGADDYITKPFNSDILVSRCNNLINTRRLLQRKFSQHPHTHAELLASNPLDKDLLDRAMKIIDRYYNDSDFNVDIFAREIGMSRTALFTKWKTLTGQTPKSFILNMRLRKAADMLRNRLELSIAEISDKNGFSSPRYFCKCFKDVYKQQPSVYRNKKDVEVGTEEE